MEKVAILYICTGDYYIFWKDFYISFEKNFLQDSYKEYFVFTDRQRIYEEDNEKVNRIYQKKMGWPYDTMCRFHIFDRITERLRNFDYILFANANLICRERVSEKEFLPEDNKLVVIEHPGFYNKKNYAFTYDRNPRCTAYIPYNKGRHYVCGGLNGGRASAYIKMYQELKKRTETDMKNGIIPLWHDESQLNKYILDHQNYRLLSPSYWYPEGWNIPFTPKIIVREKSKVINIGKIKRIAGRQKVSSAYWHARDKVYTHIIIPLKEIFNKWKRA